MRTALAGLLLWCATAQSEPLPVGQIPHRDSDLFRALLKHHGLQPTTLAEQPKAADTVLVLLGPLPADASYQRFSQLCFATGGAVLIATDRKSDLTPYFPPFNGTIAINGGIVTDDGPNTCYQPPHFENATDMPFLNFNLSATLPEPDLAAMLLLTRVATNRPSFIEARDATFLRPLAGFSPTATDRGPAMGIARAGRGKAIVLSDAAVLSNQILWARSAPNEPGTDNFQFAIQLASYLTTKPDGLKPRTKCVFWDGSRVRTDFDTVPLTPPLPDIRPAWDEIQKNLVENGEKKINELQDRGFPASERLSDRTYFSTMQWICGIAAVLTAILMLRFARAQRPDPEPVAKPAELNPLEDLSTVARDKLRAQFAAWETPLTAKPKVAVQGSWLYRYRMRKSVQELFALAFGKPRRVSGGQWKAIDASVAEIDEALRQGQLQFVRAERTS